MRAQIYFSLYTYQTLWDFVLQPAQFKATKLMLASESTKMTAIRSNPHRIFGPINIGMHEQNNSFLWTPEKITKEMKLQSVLFSLQSIADFRQMHLQIHNVDVQYQPKMKQNVPRCLKAGESKIKTANRSSHDHPIAFHPMVGVAFRAGSSVALSRVLLSKDQY